MNSFVKEKTKKNHNDLSDCPLLQRAVEAIKNQPVPKMPKTTAEAVKRACRKGNAAVWALMGVMLLLTIIEIISFFLNSAGLRPCLRDENQTAKAETISDTNAVLLQAASGPAFHPAGPDWLDELIEKIWLREASGRLEPPAGDGGKAVGPLQLHRCVIDDVNQFCGADYSYADRLCLEKSKQLARLYIELWLDRNKEELAVRIFNGGPRGWRKNATDKYWLDIQNRKGEE